MLSVPDVFTYSLIFILFGVSLALLYFYRKKSLELEAQKGLSTDIEQKLQRKLYENNLIQEINDRFGYSLNIEKAADTVIGSLQNLIPYSAASYILFEGNKLIFKSYLVESVSTRYVEDVKKRMIEALKKQVDEDISKWKLEENFVGKLVDSDSNVTVNTFFAVPLVIGGENVGVFSVSSTKAKILSETDIKLINRIIDKATEAVTKLHELVRREKGKLDSMVESMADGVVMIDEDFDVILANPACFSILGIDGRPVVSNYNDPNLPSSVKKEDSRKVSIFEIINAFGEVFPLEDTIAEVFKTDTSKSIDGLNVKGKHLQISVIPVNLGRGSKGVGVILHDQSEEWRLKMLKEDFTAMVVHELRSPLTVIAGTADIILHQRDRLDVEQENKLLQQIVDGTHSLMDIVNDLLDSAKIETGRFKINKSKNNLNDVISEQAGYYSNMIEEKGLNIVVSCDDLITEFDFDKDKVAQVLRNLISNAIRFTTEGQISVSSIKTKENEVEVTVADTGTGVSDDLKPKLFHKFTTTETKNKKGTGLGLAISKNIVESHGGTIWIEDNEPNGAKFIFRLPTD